MKVPDWLFPFYYWTVHWHKFHIVRYGDVEISSLIVTLFLGTSQ